MGSATLPAGYVRCDECRGTGREVVTDEVLDDDGEVRAEIPRDYGPCQICEGRGWLPAETPQQAAERAERERRADTDQRLQQIVDHLASGRCQARDEEGTGCYAPWRFHYLRRPGDVQI